MQSNDLNLCAPRIARPPQLTQPVINHQNWGGPREKLEYNFALDKESMHTNLKSLLDGPEQDLIAMFWLRVD